jgi:hypothetical protein
MNSLAEPVQREMRQVPLSPDAPTDQPAAVGTQSTWLHRWCGTSSLEQRLADINAMSAKRLPTYAAAEVWLHLIAKANGLLSPEQSELLLRQFIMLAPEHGKAGMMFDLLMNRQRTTTAAPALVFMITSCKRYMTQARRVLSDLQARGAEACIVVGDPSLTVAAQDGPLVSLPVSDTYEDLTSKVLEGLTYLRRRHGPVSIVKIDDDIELNGNFDLEALANAARIYDYAGEVIGEHCCDRFWHFGKTSRPTPIFTRRQQGRFALGAMYLLGPRAVEHLVREWVYYPGEFAGHIYEDRAVGDALRKANIEVASIAIDRMGGIVDRTERYITPQS